MPENYFDFSLHVGPDGHIRTHSENQGDQTASIPVEVPHDIELALELVEFNRTDEKLLKELGKRFYQMLFPPPIHTHLNQAEAAANNERERRKMRIRLTIEPDRLASLPWEFLYRERGYFFAINPDTVLSRSLDLDLPPGYVRQQESPLRLLIVIANPKDQSPLNPEEWEEKINRALALPIQKGLIITSTVKLATFENISNALLEQRPHIIQFVGHGIYEGGKGYLALVKSEADHNTWVVDDEGFANILGGYYSNLGLVSLMTCESAKSDSQRSFLGIAPQIVRRGVPAVIAMQYSVLVSTAEIFVENFYKHVAAREPIDWAMQQARNAIAIKKQVNNREFATPVLYMRARDGIVFSD